MIRLATPAPLPIPSRATGAALAKSVPLRQRAKLWELNGSFHCSIIGTCLTPAELRRVMGKLAQRDLAHVSDHDLHAEAVGLAARQTACARLLQKALDQRHQTVIRQFARLQGEDAVMAQWRLERQAGAIPGAYWAVLTHADTGHAGLRQAFGDVHMLSHLVGAANRADISRLGALEAENAALREKVERQQAALHAAITARDTTIRQLGALAAQQHRAPAEADPDDLHAGYRHLVGDLQAQLAAEAARRERIERRLTEQAEAGRRWQDRARLAEAGHAESARALAVLEDRDVPPALRRAALPPERVLYVGGHAGCVEQMRDTLQEAGGELLSHDGGRHDHPSLLPGLISRADRVVFPVDCVSHDAALTVKRVCRQLGKRWLPLRSAGLAAFLAALSEAS